jgi:hypothetical protein
MVDKLNIFRVIREKMTKKWIQKAIQHPGKFDKYCHRQHMNGATNACIKKGEHSRNTTIRREANLAATLKKLPRR